jgi:heat shock protein HspQ
MGTADSENRSGRNDGGDPAVVPDRAAERAARPNLSALRIVREAKFSLGQIVRHRLFSFRGVIFDVDPVFSNTEEWYEAIPRERRPSRDQPFYHLLAQNAQGGPYEAYVSEQNLVADAENGPVTHPKIDVLFERIAGGRYILRANRRQ